MANLLRAVRIRHQKDPFEGDIPGLLKQHKSIAKFQLPRNGTILENEKQDLQTLFKLPYPIIAIEFVTPIGYEALQSGGFLPKKWKGPEEFDQDYLVIAKEVGEGIEFYVITRVKGLPKGKVMWGGFGFPLTFLLNKEYTGDEDETAYFLDFDEESEAFKNSRQCSAWEEDHLGFKEVLKWVALPAARAILELTDALSFSNIEEVELPRRQVSTNAVKQGVLPYDQYKVLKINPRSVKSGKARESSGERLSPRQHTRRGHIRRLPNGEKIWIHPMIVGSNVGGKITKDYLLV